ncbi:MAG TPA: hypothetical protein VK557_14445 [Pyrinomonadaceae bacterium]|nr:hypothetical protein [Pyrinomonadaceae bacterium]
MSVANNVIAFPRLIERGVIVALSLVFAISATAQQRDHLTDAETDLVRFYQEIDKRTEVFIKAADRRFAIINGAAQPSTKKLVKDEPEWGDPPKGTRTELLGDIAGILDEAITNIDNVASRDAKNPLLPRSLRKLSTAANGYLNQLNSLKTKVTDPDEIAAVERVGDEVKDIMDASGHLASGAPEDDASAPDKGKKKKKP